MAAKAKRQEQPGETLVRAGRALGQASSALDRAVAAGLGVHPTAWECLTLLFDHGAMPAGRLAELTGLTTGAITGLIDRLESAYLVVRWRDAGDRRRVIVEAAPLAWERANLLVAPMLAEMQSLHDGYSADQLEAIRSCLTATTEVLRRHAARLRGEDAEPATPAH